MGTYPIAVGIDLTNVRQAAEQLVQSAAAIARAAVSTDLDVTVSIIERSRVRALLDASTDASLVVLRYLAEPEADGFRNRGEMMLAEALAGWQENFPDVQVARKLVDAHPVSGLVAESHAAYLLVVGAQGRHARVGAFLGSVSQGVLHHATCPGRRRTRHGLMTVRRCLRDHRLVGHLSAEMCSGSR